MSQIALSSPKGKNIPLKIQLVGLYLNIRSVGTSWVGIKQLMTWVKTSYYNLPTSNAKSFHPSRIQRSQVSDLYQNAVIRESLFGAILSPKHQKDDDMIPELLKKEPYHVSKKPIERNDRATCTSLKLRAYYSQCDNNLCTWQKTWMVSQCTLHLEIFPWLWLPRLLLLAFYTKYPLVTCLR